MAMGAFDAAALVGETIDRYELLELLGEGGFGAVYRAKHRFLGREVALKLIKKGHSERALERFRREAQVLATLGSPRIVRIFDSGDDGWPFLALEYLVGESLRSWHAREGCDLGGALLYAHQILEGLSVAHEAGVIHRDIKPSNVFLRETIDGAEAVLLDFGIAKSRTAASLTRTGAALGTPRFAAPEQLRSAKHVDERTDLYSAGVLLYHLLTNELPYPKASTYEQIVVAISMHPRIGISERMPELPPGLARVIDRAVSCEPSERYQSAGDFMNALLRSLQESPSTSDALRSITMTMTRPESE